MEYDSTFDKSLFLNDVFNDTYNEAELKERMRHITIALGKHLNHGYEESTKILIQAAEDLHNKQIKLSGIELIFLPDFIEIFGMDHYESSVDAMEKITPIISCEFAVRPFIIRYGERMMKKMLAWSENENHHIRRLSSEGCRPRLPWAMALPVFKKDPTPILPILENLKNDPSEYVRRSVANNLNDISKDNPEITMRLAKSWHGKSGETNSIVKHGIRSLLKNNYPGSLELIGYGKPSLISLSRFKLNTPTVKSGDFVRFSFSLKNMSRKTSLLRLEYAIYFQLSNGKEGRKVFKISERKIDGEKSLAMERKHSFRKITTRTYYKGKHGLALIVNGIEKERFDFNLI